MSTTPRVGKGRASWLLFDKVNRSVIKTIFHDVFFRNRLALRLIWGLKGPGLVTGQPYGANYADLTTVLMRWTLSRWVRAGGITRMHEIGIGDYGIQCLYMKKTFPNLVISGSTINQGEIEHATVMSRLNGVEPRYFLSDVLADFHESADMIWWNLPYYEKECLTFLQRLRDQVEEGGRLREGGLLVLGYNSIPLDAEAVQAVFASHPHFVVKRIEKYTWNPHLVVTFEFRSGRS